MKLISLLAGIFLIFTACSTTKVLESPVVSDFDINSAESLSDAAASAGFNTLEEENYYLYTGIDDEHLYVIAEIRSRAFQQRIEDYGLRLSVTSSDSWLGLTYPMGMLEALGDFQDAAVSYLMDPAWQQMPRNESIVEQAEEDIESLALLSQNPEESPARISLIELRAQNLQVQYQYEGGFYTIAYRIPLESGRSQQFSPNAQAGDALSVELTVSPPSAEDITGEELSGTTASDFGGNMTGGRRQQTHQQEQQEETLADRVDRILGRSYTNNFILQLPHQKNR